MLSCSRHASDTFNTNKRKNNCVSACTHLYELNPYVNVKRWTKIISFTIHFVSSSRSDRSTFRNEPSPCAPFRFVCRWCSRPRQRTPRWLFHRIWGSWIGRQSVDSCSPRHLRTDRNSTGNRLAWPRRCLWVHGLSRVDRRTTQKLDVSGTGSNNISIRRWHICDGIEFGIPCFSASNLFHSVERPAYYPGKKWTPPEPNRWSTEWKEKIWNGSNQSGCARTWRILLDSVSRRNTAAPTCSRTRCFSCIFRNHSDWRGKLFLELEATRSRSSPNSDAGAGFCSRILRKCNL